MPKIAAALLLSVLAGSAGAQTFLTASLTNQSENPPTVPTTVGGQPRPASFGTANFFNFVPWTAAIDPNDARDPP